MEVTWIEFKKFIDARDLSIQYFETESNYYLVAFDGYFKLECLIPLDSESADTADFLANYEPVSNDSYSDSTGRIVVRSAAANKGATYLADCCEINTSLGIYCEKWDGTDGDYEAKFYDSEDNLLTEDLSTCVLTVVDYAPDYDYEIISGRIQQNGVATQDVRLWVIGGCVDLAAYPGTIKEMVRNVNLKHCTNGIITDGRSSKYMAYNTPGVPYPTNKMRFIVTHPAGHVHSFMVSIEGYR